MCPSSKDILLNRHGITIQIRTLTLIISLPSHQQTPLEFSSCLNTVSRNQGSATGTRVILSYVRFFRCLRWESFLSLFLDFYDVDIFEDYRLITE